ncbi:MAG: DUF3619 family protein [Betaproteobacteria bacterium]|jgi:hypothetical protein|nr:DUF3619 family protein [Betaproteobacteria bacterium]
MNAAEKDFAQKIVRELDRGSCELDRSTLLRLSEARNQALDLYRQAPLPQLVLAGGHLAGLDRKITGLRYVLPLAVLVLGLAGIVYWQGSNGTDGEVADIDARLLTDDLPIDAYLDQGFDSWLKRQQR